MLNRDFTKSNKEYISKNKIPLIVLASILVVGILVMAIFGLRGNFEFTGYNEFSVTVGSDTSKYNDYISKIENVVNEFDGKYDSVILTDEGDDSKIIVRYFNKLTAEEQIAVNDEISADLSIEITKISTHAYVSPVIDNIDYIYTVVAILFLFVVGSIFAYVRYNGASAVALLVSCALATLGFISLTAILRLSIGISYLALLVILNVLVMYLAIQVFENIREESFLDANNYSDAITSGMKKARLQSCIVSCAVLVIGVLFVLFAPSALKYISLSILFMAVVLLATVSYILPFAWSMFITLAKRRKPKKNEKKKTITTKEIDESSIEETNDTTGNATIGG